ncbi:hypothetical protein ACJ41O_003499 [Fusarium nematophilum]
MSSIKKVALVGKGLVGSAVLEQLLKAGFQVTVLSRSPKDVPSGATSVQVDYSSVDSLAAALEGHEAVISTVGMVAIPSQTTIIDAAIQASVKRFIPSDFSAITNDPKASHFTLFQPSLQIKAYLEKKAQAGEIDYTTFATGPFLDFVFGGPLLVDVPNRAARLHGKGDTRVSSTSIAGVGKAVAGSLKNPEATKNRVVHVHEAVLTQAKLLELAKKGFPEGKEWTETTVDKQAALVTATDRFSENPTDHLAVLGLLQAAILSGNFDSEYIENDNELLGIAPLSDEELEKNWVPRLAKKP